MLKRFLIGVLASGALACSSDGSHGLGPDNADVSGEIQQVTVAADGSGQLRLAILGTGPDGGMNEHIFLVVNPGTPISLPSKRGAHTGTLSDLAVGDVISANVDPVVIDTFPPQYSATEIQIGASA